MPRLTLPRTRRLAHDLEFQAVFGARMKKVVGPLTVFAAPNGRAFHRLGLSIGKRVGTAPERNRVKRLIREAFRHEQGGLAMLESAGEAGVKAIAQGYDIVVSVRSGVGMTLEATRAALRESVTLAHKAWERRARG